MKINIDFTLFSIGWFATYQEYYISLLSFGGIDDTGGAFLYIGKHNEEWFFDFFWLRNLYYRRLFNRILKR